MHLHYQVRGQLKGSRTPPGGVHPQVHRIGDPIPIELVGVCQQSDNRGLPNVLEDRAHLVENKVADDARSLKAARCQLSKLSKPFNYKETVIRVSSELVDQGL